MAIYKTTDTFSIGKNNPIDPFSLIGDFPQTTAVLQPRKSGFTPTTLGTTEKIYTSESQTDINAIALWTANKGYAYSIIEGPDQVFSITITVPYDEITNTDNLVDEIVQWEIIPNIVNRDIFDAGIFTTDNTGFLGNIRYTVPPIIRAAIKEALKYGAFGALNFGQIQGTQLTDNQIEALAPLHTISQQFYNLIKSGVTSVKSSVINVKRTAVYSLQDKNARDANPYYNQILSLQNFMLTNMNPIISTRDLIQIFEPDEITRSQLLPSYLIPKSAAGAPYNDPITQFAIGGYLIHVPVRTFLTPTKIKIEQNFEFDEWLDTLYFRYSPITDFPLVMPTPYPPGYTGFPNS
jgi:hypothetical protein